VIDFKMGSRDPNHAPFIANFVLASTC